MKILLVAIIMLILAQAAQAGDWPMYGHDAAPKSLIKTTFTAENVEGNSEIMPRTSLMENTYALIIGILEHKEQRIPKLRFRCADAEGIFKLLTDTEKVGMKQENFLQGGDEIR